MKRRIRFSLLVLFGVTALFQIGLSQTIVIDIGGQTLHLVEKNIQKAKEDIKPHQKQKAHPSGENIVADKKTATSEKLTADQPKLSLADVKNLVAEFKLDKPTAQNPKLAFSDDQIVQWYEKRLNETALRYEFVARRIILEAADKQKVPIRDQDMLSHAAQDVIARMKEEKEEKPPDPATRLQTSNSETRQTSGGSTSSQLPDVSCEICPGDNSLEMLEQAWAALNASQGGMGDKNLEKALACTRCAVANFQTQADEQQATRQQKGECRTTPPGNQKDAYFASYWALADIGTAWFIRGQSLSRQQRWKEAREAYKMVIDRYSCAYTWDPKGWFWRTAEGAQKQYNAIQYK